jgi:hypothetical protein
MIFIRDGKSTPFWESKWINGVAPKEMAPSLYRKARFKKRSVYKELQNRNWIRNVKGNSLAQQLDEYVMLFIAISSIQL